MLRHGSWNAVGGGQGYIISNADLARIPPDDHRW
jgi:hypothetical protein